MYQNFKLGVLDSQHARWVSLLFRALPDDLREKPVALGYPSPDQIADILDRHVDMEGLAADLACSYYEDMLTDDGRLVWRMMIGWGTGCFNPVYFVNDQLFPSDAYGGIATAFHASDAARWFSTQTAITRGFLTISEKMPWEIRERMRQDYNQYKLPPWSGKISTILGHYAHISTSDPTKIAYTPSPQYGERNRKTVIRPGRYLKQFYPHLSDPEIATLVGDMGRDYSEYDLKFAVTPDEIEEVYTNGPDSCMSKSASSYESSEHPVRVYGDSDLQLAYLSLKKSERITARALVWPEKKRIGRIYGDELRLKKMLSDLGYTQASENGKDLIGAKFRRIHDGNWPDHHIMPYIDGTQAYRIVDKNWLVISDCGDEAGYTHGLDVDDPGGGYVCDCCEDRMRDEDAFTVHTSRRNEQTWCRNCYENSTSYCDYSDVSIPDDAAQSVLVPTPTGYTERTWANWVVENNARYCDHFDSYVSDEVEFFDMENGQTWCAFAFKERGIEIDGKYYDKDDVEIEPSTSPTEADAWLSRHGNYGMNGSWEAAIAVATRWEYTNTHANEHVRKQQLQRALAA
jgi:hypothetical protein